MTSSERLTWTAALVDPRPGERVLEVGCGHGVLLSLLAARPDVGTVVGVDRSPAMGAAAAGRNQAAVTAGRVRLQVARFTDADLADESADVVVSFNVRAFWTPPAPEWDVVARVLAPGGRVVVAFSLMAPEAGEPIVRAVRELAGARGFALTTVHHGDTAPVPSMAVELRPGRPGVTGRAGPRSQAARTAVRTRYSSTTTAIATTSPT
jgi:SAM-dependent methyltransferase